MTAAAHPPIPALFLKLPVFTPEAAKAYVMEAVTAAADIEGWDTMAMTPAFRKATAIEILKATQAEVAEALAYLEAMR